MRSKIMLLFVVLGGALLFAVFKSQTNVHGNIARADSFVKTGAGKSDWIAPSLDTLQHDERGDLIKYGRDLIANTSKYLGPKGIIAKKSNGMNCQNCHLEAGARSFGNCFSAVASTYPKYRDRSGRIESIEFRVNECMERSLNGEKLDSLSHEMRAMVAYLKWLGQHVPKGIKPVGAGTEELSFLNRAASIENGQSIYIKKCQTCHGVDGQGKFNPDSATYLYPPLWGSNSYNVSAGLFRLTRFAGYVKNSMPFGSSHEKPQLTNEEAWDVAAFVNSQPRPRKLFAYDWPKISAKPVDYPFGPYTDGFNEEQHKYGPFEPIKNSKEKLAKSSSAEIKK